MQTLHYLTLALLAPPLLSLFAEPSSVEYEGGATNVGMPLHCRSYSPLTSMSYRDGNGLETDGWKANFYVYGPMGLIEQGLERREAGRRG